MTKARKKLYWKFGIIYIVLVLYIASTPTQALWDRLEPHFLGLPFNEWNIILVQLAIAVLMMIFFIQDRNLHLKEKEMRKRGEKIEY